MPRPLARLLGPRTRQLTNDTICAKRKAEQGSPTGDVLRICMFQFRAFFFLNRLRRNDNKIL